MLKTAYPALMAGLLGLGTGTVQAITIYELDASGNVVGGPIITSWQVYSGSPASDATVSDASGGAGTNWTVRVGVNNFGAAENGTQVAAIRGAGVELPAADGYRIEFEFSGYSWDSYNTTFPGSPNASTGYQDVFAVNINQTDYYWNLVDGGAGMQNDPIVSPDPAGEVVIDNSILPGITWAWGGLDALGGFFEEEHGTYSLILLGNSTRPYFLSAVLDTATTPDTDENFPSWGCFNLASSEVCTRPQGGQSQGIPEPASGSLLGLGLAGLSLLRRCRQH